MTQFKKCSIIMLATENESIIQRKNNLFPSSGLTQADIDKLPKEGTLLDFKKPFKNINNKYWEPQHLYILSDEEIKLGDSGFFMCFDFNDPYLFKSEGLDQEALQHAHSKITATTNSSLSVFLGNQLDGRTGIYGPLPRPSDSFVKKYCELGGIKEVMVEYEKYGYCEGCSNTGVWHCAHADTCGNSEVRSKIKIAPDNTITIKRVKDNWNKEEVIELAKKAYNAGEKYGRAEVGEFYGGKENECLEFNEWIEKNL